MFSNNSNRLSESKSGQWLSDCPQIQCLRPCPTRQKITKEDHNDDDDDDNYQPHKYSAFDKISPIYIF